MTEMTEQDLKDGQALADRIVEMIKDMRPPTAVAGIALALAATTHLAKCGPRAAKMLFDHFYAVLGAAGAAGGEAVSKWKKDAPDHWSRKVDDNVTLAVWPRGMPVRDWVWEVFDFRIHPDNPIKEGAAATFEEAKARAVEAQQSATDVKPPL